MAEENQNKDQIFEDVEVVLSMPYNVPIERVMNDTNFDVRIFKRNGEKPFVKVRYPKSENKK